jgi:large subunit ribosomal protein L35
MPKMKSHSGAKKRFSFTASGKVKFKRAKMRHILEKKAKTMKRKARKTSLLKKQDAKHIRVLLPYGR